MNRRNWAVAVSAALVITASGTGAAQAVAPVLVVPQVAVQVSAPLTPAYEIRYIKKVCRWIVGDMQRIDYRLGDGIAVSSAMWMLAENYDRLLDSPAPAGVSRSKYYARLATLSDFMNEAADDYDYAPTSATAQYLAVKKHTKPVFKAVNAWLGTGFRVPS
jgi:hypothetical protein